MSEADSADHSPGSPASNPIHVVQGTSTKVSRHEALRALHEGLARAERNLHDLLHSGHARPADERADQPG